MKSTQRLFLLLAFSIGLFGAKAQNTNAETHIQKFFASLKAKDEKAFVGLYPNAAQFSAMMRTMMQNMLSSEQMQQMMAADPKTKDMNIDSLIGAEVDKISSPEAFGEMQKKFANTYSTTISKGESKGVNWSDASYSSVTIDSAAEMFGEMEMLKDAGFKSVKGIIDFRSAGQDYQMSFNKIIFIPSEGNWFGGEFPQIAKKGESLEPDSEISELAADTTVMESPKTKTKSKTKAKTSTTKTKTKTKTPARKPATKS